MKRVQLGLLLTISLFFSSCHKSQVVGKINITTTLEKPAMGMKSPLVLHWAIAVQEEAGIEQVTILFSDSSTPLEFPNILRDTWSLNNTKEFAANAIPDSWTIAVSVLDQEGNISEETSTIELQ